MGFPSWTKRKAAAAVVGIPALIMWVYTYSYRTGYLAAELKNREQPCPPFKTGWTLDVRCSKTEQISPFYEGTWLEYFSNEAVEGHKENECANEARGGAWTGYSDAYYIPYAATVSKLMGLKLGGKFFEAGSGCGQLVSHVAATEPGLQGHGVDMTPSMVKYSNAKHKGIFCQGAVENLSYIPSDTFDGSFTHGVFEYLKDTTIVCQAILEMVRVTKPGGRVVLSRVEDPAEPTECEIGAGTKITKTGVAACLQQSSKKVGSIVYSKMEKEPEGEGDYCASGLYNSVIAL